MPAPLSAPEILRRRVATMFHHHPERDSLLDPDPTGYDGLIFRLTIEHGPSERPLFLFHCLWDNNDASSPARVYANYPGLPPAEARLAKYALAGFTARNNGLFAEATEADPDALDQWLPTLDRLVKLERVELEVVMKDKDERPYVRCLACSFYVAGMTLDEHAVRNRWLAALAHHRAHNEAKPK